MAILNWREVSAPNFGGTASALQTFGNLLNNSTQGFSDALGAFGKAQDAMASRQVLEQAMRFNDPQAYQRALADGTVTAGVDPRSVDAATLTALMNRTGNLQNQASNQQTFDTRAADQLLANQQRQSREAALPGVREMYASRGLEVPAGLNFADTRQLGEDMARGRADDLRVASATNSAERDKILLDDLRRKDAEGKVTRQAQADTAAVFDPQGAITYMSTPEFQKKPEAEKLIYRNVLEQKHGTLFGLKGTNESLTNTLSSGGTAGATTASAPATSALSNAVSPTGSVAVGGGYDTVVGNQRTAKPLTQMTVGEVIAEGKKTWIPATKGNAALGLGSNEGSSAAGRYQITGQTLEEFGKKVYGTGWDSQPFSPEVQDKVGEAIFNARKVGNLTDTWVGLKSVPGANVPGAFKDKTWAEVKDTIARTETGGSPTNPAATLTTAAKPGALPVPSSAAVDATGNRLATQAFRLAGTEYNMTDLMESQKSRASAAEAAAELRKGGIIQVGESKLRDSIERISREGQVTPATAAALLARGAVETSALSELASGPIEFFGGSVRGNNAINTKQENQIIADLRGSSLEDRLSQQQSLNDNINALDRVRTERTRLAGEVAQLTAQAKADPRMQAQLDNKQKELASAGQNLARLNALLATSGNPLPPTEQETITRVPLRKGSAPVTVASLQADLEKVSPFDITERTRIRRELEKARAAR